MKKFVLLAAMALFPAAFAAANEGDLVLPGERWIAKFDKYVCAAFGAAVARPAAFEEFNVNFEQITTDRTLDNILLKASFEENGVYCRYNAFLFADNAEQTVRFVESKAYAPNGGSDCAGGKALLDTALQFNKYLYYGHPHNAAIMVSVPGAEAVCGQNLIGVNFVVKGRVPQAK